MIYAAERHNSRVLFKGHLRLTARRGDHCNAPEGGLALPLQRQLRRGKAQAVAIADPAADGVLAAFQHGGNHVRVAGRCDGVFASLGRFVQIVQVCAGQFAGSEIEGQAEIMLLEAQPGDPVVQHVHILFQAHGYPAVIYRIVGEYIAVVAHIDRGILIVFLKPVQEQPDTPHPADPGHRAHGQIVAVQGIVGKGACKIMPPVFPDGLIINIAAPVQQDILPGDLQLEMPGIVVAVGALFAPFQLHAVDMHIAVLRPPAGAHDMDTRFFHGEIALGRRVAQLPSGGNPLEIAPARPFRHLTEPGPHFIQVIRVHG